MPTAIDSSWLPIEKRLIVAVEFTNVCNFRCPICPVSYRKKNGIQPAGAPYERKFGYMSEETFVRVLSECQRIARTVELSFFGEQTLHASYLQMLSSMKDRSFKLETNTNMSRVNRDTMDTWVDVDMDLVRISLDAVTSSVFNRARPGDVFDMEGNRVPQERRLETVNNKVREWLSRPDHRPTRLVYVKSSNNDAENEKDKFVEYWKGQLGPMDQILCKRVLTYGGKVLDEEVRSGQCNVWEQGYLVIDHKGNVSPCNLDINMDLQLGNVMDASIESLYYSQKSENLKQQTGCGRNILPCRFCVDANNWSDNEYYRHDD